MLWSLLLGVFGAAGLSLASVRFSSSGTGIYSKGPAGSLYIFNVTGSNLGNHLPVGQVKAFSTKISTNISYFISKFSHPGYLMIDRESGVLRMTGAPTDEDGPQKANVFFVRAEESSSGGPLISGSSSVAKVVVNFFSSTFVLPNDTVNFGVYYQSAVKSVLGRIQLFRHDYLLANGISYIVGEAHLNNPAINEHLGEIAAFDMNQQTGELSTAIRLSEYNQKRLDIAVTAISRNGSAIAQRDVRVWVYDDPQELELIFDVPFLELVDRGYLNLTKACSLALGGTVAIGKVGNTATGSSAKLVVLDSMLQHVLDGRAVLLALQRKSPEWLKFENQFSLRSVQTTQRLPPRWDISLTAIILIVICSALLMGIFAVLLVFCTMKRRYEYDTSNKGIAFYDEQRCQQRTYTETLSGPYSSSDTIPAPYSFGNPVAGFQRPYEEQEISLSISPDIESALSVSPGCQSTPLNDVPTPNEPSML